MRISDWSSDVCSSDPNTIAETTTAGAIAHGLINAEVTYSQSDGGRGWNASTDVDTGNITIYGNAAKQNDTGLARTIAETTTAGAIAHGLINAEVTYSQSDGGRGWKDRKSTRLNSSH